ncbi:MAG: ester cyclase [Saprospiraceae bacterium]
MTNSIKQLVAELHGYFSANNFEKTLSMMADDIRVEAFALGATFEGREGAIQFMQGFKGAFPDLQITHKNIVENGSEVAVEFTATGKHTGDLHTPAGVVPPTGKIVNFTVCEVQTWENGKVKSIRNYQDSGSLMRQLGLI